MRLAQGLPKMKSFRICSQFGLLLVGLLLCGIGLPYFAKALVCYKCGIVTKGPKTSEDPCYNPRRKGAPFQVCKGSYRTSYKGATGSSTTGSHSTESTEALTSSSTEDYIIIEPPEPNYTDFIDVCWEAYDKDLENHSTFPFLYRGCDFVYKDFKKCNTYGTTLSCYCNQRDLCNDEVGDQFGLTIGRAASLRSPHALLGFPTGHFQLLLSIFLLLFLNNLDTHQSEPSKPKVSVEM